MNLDASLLGIITAHKRGIPVGIYSICSAHPFVLAAAVQRAMEDGTPLLVESTCNQVNQEGGYTGLTPAAFREYLWDIVDRCGLPRQQLILGGDHLGPGPWQRESAEHAMDQARVLMRDCVRAGYTKIHLDASVRCADDPPDRPLDKAIVAEREAELCLVAEQARLSEDQPAPCYVVGTEVPPPGGTQGHAGAPAVTRPADVQETIESTHQTFQQRGLEAAWQRVVAVVVQPGVEFGDDTLFEYDRQAAARLSRFIAGHDRLVFEAHSTDYQTRDALRALVEDHFAILKVGPALTFAFREAVFALAMIETEWLAGRAGVELSNLQQILDNAMLDNPADWQKYYIGPEPGVQLARKYSFSDRARYYWSDSNVQKALAHLLDNLGRYPIPLTLLSQFLPRQYEQVRAGQLLRRPRDLICDKIRAVLADYVYASRW